MKQNFNIEKNWFKYQFSSENEIVFLVGDSTVMSVFSLLPTEEALPALAKSIRSHVRGQLFESIFPQPPGVSDLLLCFKKTGKD